MGRQFAALLVALLLGPQVMTGCKSATEPSTDPGSFAAYAGWVGTWVGTDASHQINLQVRSGASYKSCGAIESCEQYRDLLYTVSFSDAETGYSGTNTSVFETNLVNLLISHPGLAPGEVEFVLRTEEVTGRPGVHLVTTFRGTLQGSLEAKGAVVVRLFDSNTMAAPVTTSAFAMTLRKQ
jgi:hypothetical protein